jgi:RNA polymerase sigma factor (sigma-70 family)
VTDLDETRLARFEENRARLKALAHRMLGSASEADDAVQEAWIRFQSADVSQIENVRGWLTTALARICLTVLRARRTRSGLLDQHAPILDGADVASPEDGSLMADSVGLALHVVLDTLEPPERTSFVLHDMFDLPFDEIARIVSCSPVAARQLASRARKKIRGASPTSETERAARQKVVDAFIAASRDGDFEALLAVLDPSAVLRSDALAVRTAAANKDRGALDLGDGEIRGAANIASTLRGRARPSRALVDGEPGAVWLVEGNVRAAWLMRVEDERITRVDIVMEHVEDLEIELLDP